MLQDYLQQCMVRDYLNDLICKNPCGPPPPGCLPPEVPVCPPVPPATTTPAFGEDCCDICDDCDVCETKVTKCCVVCSQICSNTCPSVCVKKCCFVCSTECYNDYCGKANQFKSKCEYECECEIPKTSNTFNTSNTSNVPKCQVNLHEDPVPETSHYQFHDFSNQDEEIIQQNIHCDCNDSPPPATATPRLSPMQSSQYILMNNMTQQQQQPPVMAPQTQYASYAQPNSTNVSVQVPIQASQIPQTSKTSTPETVIPKAQVTDEISRETGTINTVTDTTLINQPNRIDMAALNRQRENCLGEAQTQTSNSSSVPHNNRAGVYWRTRISGYDVDIGSDIVTDSEGNVIVLGYAAPSEDSENLSGNPVMVVYNPDDTIARTVNNSNLFDAFIVKFNSFGCVMWIVGICGSIGDRTMGLAVDANNAIIVVGSYKDRIISAYNADSKLATCIDLVGEISSFVFKYNSQGFIIWSSMICGSDIASALDVATDLDSNIIVTGYYNGPDIVIYNSDETRGATLPPSNNNSIFVVKYTLRGTVVWTTIITHNLKNYSLSVTTDSSNDILLTGYRDMGDFVIFDAPNGTPQSLVSLPVPNSNALFLIKYNTQGKVQWATQITGITVNNRVGIDSNRLDPTNAVFITGCYTDAPTIYDAPNASVQSSITLSADNTVNTFLVKYNASGIAQWGTRVNGKIDVSISNVAADKSSGSALISYYESKSITIYNSNGNSGPTLAAAQADSANVFVARFNADGHCLWATKIANVRTENYIGITFDLCDYPIISVSYSDIEPILIYNSDGTLVSKLSNPGTFDTVIVKYYEYLQNLLLPQGVDYPKSLAIKGFNNTTTLIDVTGKLAINIDIPDGCKVSGLFSKFLMNNAGSKISMLWKVDRWTLISAHKVDFVK